MDRVGARTIFGVGLALAAVAGFPGEARGAPVRCDLPLTVTPATIPTGSRTARIRFPSGVGETQLRSSSGTVGPPVSLVAGTVESEFVASPDSPPVVLVAALGTNACGYAVIRVASTVAVPPVGNPVTLAIVDPAAVSADRDSEVAVYVLSVDERGAPRRGASPTIQPGVGTIARIEPFGPGAWRGRWRIPAGEASAVGVAATFGDERPATASLSRAPGEPQTIEVAKEPGTGGPQAKLLARIRDSAGNLTDGPLVLESEVARFDPPRRQERGVYEASFTLPPDNRSPSIVITARADRAIATATIEVTPSAAAKVRVAPRGAIAAGDPSEGRFEVLEVEVVDAFGNPVEDVPAGSAGRGEFRPALPISPGHWALPYRPPQVAVDTTEVVVVTAGAASTSVSLELRARRLSFSPGLKGGAGTSGGTVAPAAGVELGLWTFLGRTQLGLVLDAGWWMVSTTGAATVGGTASTYQSTQTYFPLLLSLAWRTPFAGRWMAWASAGGGGALVSSRSELSGQPAVTENGFAPAASAALSAGPRLGPGWMFVEARATWLGDPGLSTLSGSTFTFLGLLGYRFDVG